MALEQIDEGSSRMNRFYHEEIYRDITYGEHPVSIKLLHDKFNLEDTEAQCALVHEAYWNCKVSANMCMCGLFSP